MSGEPIYLQDVLHQMKQPDANGKAIPFSITRRTLNKYSKTGGKLKHYPQAKLVMNEKNPNPDSVMSLRTVPKKRPKFRKNPNHFENKTRNIRILPQGNIETIHIRHIIEFNNQKVIY